jgi:hypothetical protein
MRFVIPKRWVRLCKESCQRAERRDEKIAGGRAATRDDAPMEVVESVGKIVRRHADLPALR